MIIKVNVKDEEKFRLACQALNVRVIETMNFGSITQVQVSCKPSDLYEVGKIEDKILKPTEKEVKKEVVKK